MAKKVSAFTVKCYMCGKRFQPDPEQVTAWGNSGRDFDPTDWACKPCLATEPPYEEPEFPYGEFDNGAHWKGEW